MKKAKNLSKKTYYKIGITNNVTDNTDLQIEYFGHEATKPDKETVYSKTLPFYRLIFIVSGSVVLHSNDTSWKLYENTFFLLSPNKTMSYEIDPLCPAVIYYVGFSGVRAREIVSLMGFLENEYIVYQKKPLDLVRTFENNFKYANSPLTNTIFTKNFMRIVELLYKNRDNPIDNQLRKKNTYVESTIRFINEHYSESNLSIKDIATQLFIHENHLSRILKNHLGISFTELLTQKRMDVALKLFESGETNITEVALSVGFSNPYYFSKLFKKQNLITPSAHIKKIAFTQNNAPKN